MKTDVIDVTELNFIGSFWPQPKAIRLTFSRNELSGKVDILNYDEATEWLMKYLSDLFGHTLESIKWGICL